MLLVPFEYLKKKLLLPLLTPSEITEKLTYFGLETQLVEKRNQVYLEINPLPNRADLNCWLGIVQEIKILLDCSEKKSKLKTLKANEKKIFSVSIDDPHCFSFGLTLIKNIQVKESPVWLKECLEVNQIAPVNNLIDGINLIRLETGQFWRIYDYEILKNKKKISVEQARRKEVVRLISSGQELVINLKDLVVRADREIISVIGIAEVEKFGCNFQTKNVLVEGSSFNSLPSTKKNPQFLNSFFPFSEILPNFVSFLKETQKNNLDLKVIFSYQKTSPKFHLIRVSQIFLEKKIGQSFSAHQIEKIWKRLNFSYSKKGKIYQVQIPFYRPDLRIPEDLLEELSRIYDYNQIVSWLPL
ncbi:MAG: phenylalanyl-tRNA synthetase [Mycoplasmataceae bacterium RC_NB112A]|nr:MAG: phenylalanyl-tRNA synthetase [Mycoplasmataceae bacterium RC_NB112A]KLL02190.1 MAG: phenylalanyl-tRNA synthetase [Mycoplasmataceae bacterium RC_NB112A]